MEIWNVRKIIFALTLLLSACGNQEQIDNLLETKPEVKKEIAEKYFTQSDSLRLNYCLCDSLYLIPSDSNFKGNGTAKLFTLKKRIAQCGVFQNYNLIYGLKFIYNKQKDSLLSIQKYFKGNLLYEQKISEIKNFDFIDSCNNVSLPKVRAVE